MQPEFRPMSGGSGLAGMPWLVSSALFFPVAYGHGDYLVRGAWRAAPVTEKQEIFGGELNRAGPPGSVGKDVFIKYFVKARYGDAQGGGGFRFRV